MTTRSRRTPIVVINRLASQVTIRSLNDTFGVMGVSAMQVIIGICTGVPVVRACQVHRTDVQDLPSALRRVTRD